MPVAVHSVRAEMAVHLPACRHGLPFGVRIRVELGEILLHIEQPQGHHQGLVAVVPAAEITVAELAGEGQLRHLLAITEDAEFGLARQHFLSAEQGSLTADASKSVIVQGDLPQVLPRFQRECFSHGR